MKKNIQRWIVAVVFFAVGSVYSLWFVYKKTVLNMLLVLLFFALASIFYIRSTKKITMSGGYTAIQARQFYVACLKAGLNSDHAFFGKKEEQQKIVKKFDFSKSMDKKEIRQLYYDGKQIYELMKRDK